MQPRFLLACATWLCYEVCVSKYDENHNHGIGPVLFASICVMTAGFKVRGLPEHDTGHQIITISLILWPGVLWGLVLFLLLSTEDTTACSWLILSPVLTALLGQAVLSKSNPCHDRVRDLRIVTGFGCIGILMGHFSGKSSLGRAISGYASLILSPLTAFPMLQVTIGIAITFFSVAGLVQCLVQTTTDLAQSDKKSPDLQTSIHVRFWRPSSSMHVSSSAAGLALCITSIDHAQARAVLASISIAIVVTIAFIPPFSGKIYGRLYGDYLRLLLVLHVIVVLPYCLYHTLLVRPGMKRGLDDAD